MFKPVPKYAEAARARARELILSPPRNLKVADGTLIMPMAARRPRGRNRDNLTTCPFCGHVEWQRDDDRRECLCGALKAVRFFGPEHLPALCEARLRVRLEVTEAPERGGARQAALFGGSP